MASNGCDFTRRKQEHHVVPFVDVILSSASQNSLHCMNIHLSEGAFKRPSLSFRSIFYSGVAIQCPAAWRLCCSSASSPHRLLGLMWSSQLQFLRILQRIPCKTAGSVIISFEENIPLISQAGSWRNFAPTSLFCFARISYDLEFGCLSGRATLGRG